MIDFFQEMSPFLKTITTLGITFISGLGIAFFKSKMFQSMMTGIFDWFKRDPKQPEVPENPIGVKEVDIINHDVLNYIDFWLYNHIPSINLRTQYRTAVFRKYLHIYFKTYRDVIYDFIRDDSYKTMESSQLRKSLLHLITDITRLMENEMRSVGIPDVIILKMKNVLNDRINLTMDLINSICDSSFYDSENNLLKIYSFLNIIHSILDNTISKIEPVCDDLNGELSGLSIDGYTEPVSKKRKK